MGENPWNALYASISEPAIKAGSTCAHAAYLSDTGLAAFSLCRDVQYNEYLGTAVVTEDKDTLTLMLGPGGVKSYPLKHFDRDVFTYFPDEETPDIPSAVMFEIGPDQKASQMTIENLNDDGQGVLGRIKGSNHVDDVLIGTDEDEWICGKSGDEKSSGGELLWRTHPTMRVLMAFECAGLTLS